MAAILQPQEGEQVSLPPPFGGEMIVKTGTLGLEGVPVVLLSLTRNGSWPVLRLPSSDLSLFIHKGQGRAEVAGQSRTIVPGVTITVPRGQWFSLRNTGTGLLQLVCAFSSAGPILYFQALAQQQPAADSGAVELRQPAAGAPAAATSAASPATAPASKSAPPVRPRRHRRHRRGKGRAVSSAQSAGAPPAARSAVPPPAAVAATTPAATAPAPKRTPPAARQQSSARSRTPSSASHLRKRPYSKRRGFVKEVFMNGKWVRVSGEGPVVASGDS